MRNYIPAPGIFFKKSFFCQLRGFLMKNINCWKIGRTWLRLTREGETIEFFDLITVKYRADAGVGTSTNKVYLTDKKLCFDLEIKPFKKTDRSDELSDLQNSVNYFYVESITPII